MMAELVPATSPEAEVEEVADATEAVSNKRKKVTELAPLELVGETHKLSASEGEAWSLNEPGNPCSCWFLGVGFLRMD